MTHPNPKETSMSTKGTEIVQAFAKLCEAHAPNEKLITAIDSALAEAVSAKVRECAEIASTNPRGLVVPTANDVWLKTQHVGEVVKHVRNKISDAILALDKPLVPVWCEHIVWQASSFVFKPDKSSAGHECKVENWAACPINGCLAPRPEGR